MKLAGPTRAFHCELDDEQDAWETQAFQRSVFRRLARKVAAFAARHGRVEQAHAVERLTSGPGPFRIGPEHAFTLFQDPLDDGDASASASRLAACIEMLRAAQSDRAAIGTSAASAPPAWAKWAIARFADTTAVTLGSSLASESSDKVHHAYELLTARWPEGARHVGRIVREVVWVSGDGFWSGSDVNVFGAVFANPGPGWSVPHHYETLVHEAAHHGLLIKQTLDPLIENADDLGAAPLRPDQRPLIGVLHGVFALIRMVKAHTLYLASSEGPDRQQASALRGEGSEQLRSGIATLRAKARFTPRGEELMTSIETSYRDLRDGWLQ